MPSTVRMVSSITVLPARYMSWASSARNSSGPVVGRLNTMAVLVLQGADHLLVDRHAARLQVVDHGAQVVAGRELDDDERHHQDRQHGDRNQQDAA